MNSLKYENIEVYPVLKLSDIEVIGTRKEDGLEIRDLAVGTPFGFKRVAQQIRPESGKDLASALFVHWYEPAEPAISNRFQFVEEAKELARKGTICLCVETLWSDLDFFYKRSQDEDLQLSYQEIIILRRFLDLLLMDSNGDGERTLLVGHDFGAMYGMALCALDQRIKQAVFMAATARFSDWYLYYPELDEEKKPAFIEGFTSIDPLTMAALLEERPTLFQFGNADPHVPREKAQLLFEAAAEPKEIKWYKAGHGLNDEARKDRTSWIHSKLFQSSNEGRI